MPSNHLNDCHPLSSCLNSCPSSGFFPSESALPIRWPKYWSFSFSISPLNEYSGLISLGLTGLISSLSKRWSRVFSSTTIWQYQFFCTQPFLWSSSHMTTGKSIALMQLRSRYSKDLGWLTLETGLTFLRPWEIGWKPPSAGLHICPGFLPSCSASTFSYQPFWGALS